MKSVVAASLIALASVWCGAAAQAAPPRAKTSTTYDRLVDAVVAHYHLPGIAVGVIENGKVVYKRVEGKLPSGQPMNDQTLFKIGSTTKAMTVTLLARLAEAGKLDWNAPVTRYLPDFRMYDPWVTEHMQVADLLSHHSGLPGFAGDPMLWPHPNAFTPDDVVTALRYMKPAYNFRAGYAYDNVLYVTAGQVAIAAGGAPFPELLRREVFQPLGMSRCQIGAWNRDEIGNVAQPHVWRHDHYVGLPVGSPMVQPVTMAAAGGVSCGLDDMLTWTLNWLAPTPPQLAWLTPKQREIEWTPHTPVPISKWRREWNDTKFFSNALGWRVSDADGEMTVWHTGVLSGMRAAVMLVPYRKSGFVVLINSSADDALTVIDEVLLKQLIAPGTGLSVATYAKQLAGFQAEERTPRPDVAAAKPATPTELQARTGTWESPWFGKVLICPRGEGVHLASVKSPLLNGPVVRLGNDDMVLWDHDEYDPTVLHFATQDGTVHLTFVDHDDDFPEMDFTRAGGCQ